MKYASSLLTWIFVLFCYFASVGLFGVFLFVCFFCCCFFFLKLFIFKTLYLDFVNSKS